MKLLFAYLVAGLTVPAYAVQQSDITFDSSDKGRIAVLAGKLPVAQFVWDDPKIPRPYFCDLRTIEGTQVSRTHPPVEDSDVADHPDYHPGLWMAFGDISGSDYWRNKATVKCKAETIKTSQLQESSTVSASFNYLDEEEPSTKICSEQFRCTFVGRTHGYLMLWDSSFSSKKPFYFGDQEEMGLGVRVATSIRAESRERGEIPPGTGRILDAEGRLNGEQVWGNSSQWCDYRGDVDDKTVGITILCHPDNFRPSWFHARDYGLLLANPFGRRAFKKGELSKVEVEPGDALRLRYGVFVYTVPDTNDLDLNAFYKDYVELEKAIGK